MDLAIGIDGLQEATSALQQALLLGMRNGLEKGGWLGEKLVSQFSPVGATGNLAAGIASQVDLMDDGLALSIFAGPPADVYSAPVEFGARPHTPPAPALLLWVQRKLGVDDEKQALSIAFAIARTIAARGTRGQHMFERAWEQLQQQLPGILETEIAEALRAAGFG